jgi:tRNA threonylcarbamoyladenosine biosynthesis protein TsaB
MLRAIAIETSGRVGTLAAVADGAVVDERTFPHGLKHAAEVVPLIDALCRAHGWSPRQLDHLHVSVGPGSFTGLRIAVTLAKTLALATGVKIVAVPTTRVLVENAPPEAQHVIITVDAKRGQILTARYQREEDGWREQEGARLDTLTGMLDRAPRPVHLLGEGLAHHQQFVPSVDTGVIQTSPALWQAQARIVARLGHTMALWGTFADPLTLAPLYIRLPEAEERRLAAQGDMK